MVILSFSNKDLMHTLILMISNLKCIHSKTLSTCIKTKTTTTPRGCLTWTNVNQVAMRASHACDTTGKWNMEKWSNMDIILLWREVNLQAKQLDAVSRNSDNIVWFVSTVTTEHFIITICLLSLHYMFSPSKVMLLLKTLLWIWLRNTSLFFVQNHAYKH